MAARQCAPSECAFGVDHWCAAFVTVVWLDAGVRQHVFLLLTVEGELLRTEVTLKRSDFGGAIASMFVQ